MEIKLNLKKHCVQTECKRQYEQALSRYFKTKGQDAGLESVIELLQRALAELDFGRLRSRYPALAGGTDESVVLTEKAGTPCLAINGQVCSA